MLPAERYRARLNAMSYTIRPDLIDDYFELIRQTARLERTEAERRLEAGERIRAGRYVFFTVDPVFYPTQD